MTASRRPIPAIAALVLFAAALAARFLLHPNTPYKAFLVGTAPVVALWLVAILGFAARGAPRRRLAALIAAAAASFAIVAGWCLRPEISAPLSIAWAAPAMIGIWLAILLLLAACGGALNAYFRHGPMTALGVAAVVYALAAGFAALPFGAPMMTAGMIWIAVWQGVYLYRVRLP